MVAHPRDEIWLESSFDALLAHALAEARAGRQPDFERLARGDRMLTARLEHEAGRALGQITQESRPPEK